MNKKKIVVCLVALFFVPAVAFGGFAIKVGLNFTDIAFKHAANVNWEKMTAWRLGGSFTWKLSKRLSLQPELFLSQAGTRCRMEVSGDTIRVSEKYHYIEIPLLVAFRLFTFKDLKMVLVAGGYGAFNLTARQTVNGPEGKFSDSIRSQINTFDFGWVLGAEWGKRVGKGTVTVDLRYFQGLSNINRSAPYLSEMRQRMVSLLLGYRF